MKTGHIKYSNAKEREWAIAQAKRIGAKKWSDNAANRCHEDDCIVIDEDGEWYDMESIMSIYETEIPLERPEEQVYWSAGSEDYMYDTEKYMATERPDGTIILKPRKVVKVFFVVYQFKEDGSLSSWGYNTEEDRDKSIKIEEDDFLVIDKFEKEYEI